MPTRDKYTLYVGQNIKTVSLWVQEGDREYPIYANTRGKASWFAFDPTQHENTEPQTLSDEFVTWLDEYHRRITGTGETRPNRDLPEVEWYEREVLNKLANPILTDEAQALLQWAHEVEHDGL